MKKLILSAGLLTSLSSFANCPNLTGKYHCVDSGSILQGPSSVSFGQSTSQEGVTTYQVSSNGGSSTSLIADGQERSVLWEGAAVLIAATCEDKQLKLNFLNTTSADDDYILFTFKASTSGTDLSADYSSPEMGKGSGLISKCSKI